MRLATRFALVAAFVFSACGGSKNPTAPVAPNSKQANVTTSSFNVSASSQGVGTTASYTYTVTIAVHESAGVGATISGVDLTWCVSDRTLFTKHFDSPLLASYGNRITGYSNAVTQPLVATDADATHPIATHVDAAFTFVDDKNNSGSVKGGTDFQAALPPVIKYFSATDETAGHTAVLNGTIVGATSATIDNGIGPVTMTRVAGVPLLDGYGYVSVTIPAPHTSTTYTLTATSQSGGTATASVVLLYGEVEYKVFTDPPPTPSTPDPLLYEVSYIDSTGQWTEGNHNHYVTGLDAVPRGPFRAGQPLGVTAYVEAPAISKTLVVQILKHGVAIAESRMGSGGWIKATATF